MESYRSKNGRRAFYVWEKWKAVQGKILQSLGFKHQKGVMDIIRRKSPLLAS